MMKNNGYERKNYRHSSSLNRRTFQIHHYFRLTQPYSFLLTESFVKYKKQSVVTFHFFSTRNDLKFN